jgi:hypothetical protein
MHAVIIELFLRSHIGRIISGQPRCSVIVACDENPIEGSSNELHNDGVALGMAHSLEARGLEERVAEIDYRKSSQPERALRKRHGFEYGRFRESS